MRLADVPLLAAWLRFGGGGMTVRRVALRAGLRVVLAGGRVRG